MVTTDGGQPYGQACSHQDRRSRSCHSLGSTGTQQHLSSGVLLHPFLRADRCWSEAGPGQQQNKGESHHQLSTSVLGEGWRALGASWAWDWRRMDLCHPAFTGAE